MEPEPEGSYQRIDDEVRELRAEILKLRRELSLKGEEQQQQLPVGIGGPDDGMVYNDVGGVAAAAGQPHCCRPVPEQESQTTGLAYNATSYNDGADVSEAGVEQPEPEPHIGHVPKVLFPEEPELEILLRVCEAKPIQEEELKNVLRNCADPGKRLVESNKKKPVVGPTGVEQSTTGTTTALHEICKNQTLTSGALKCALEHPHTRECLLSLGDDEEGLSPAAWICKNKSVNKDLLDVVSEALPKPKACSHIPWLLEMAESSGRQGTLLHLLCSNEGITSETLADPPLKETFKIYFKTKTDCVDSEEKTPLHKLCENKDFLRSLGQADIRVGMAKDQKESGDEDRVGAATMAWLVGLGDGAWKTTSGDGSTPLHTLCKDAAALPNGSMASVCKLIDVWEKQNEKGQTPLHVLCKYRGCKIISTMQGNDDVKKFWSQHMRKVWNRTDEYKYRPFDLLCNNPYVDSHVLKALIDLKLLFLWETNPEDSNALTPLHVLCCNTEALNAPLVKEMARMLDEQPTKDQRASLLGEKIEIAAIEKWLTDDTYKRDADTKHFVAKLTAVVKWRKEAQKTEARTVEPLHVLFAACKYFYLRKPDEDSTEDGSMFKVAVSCIPELADLMRTTQKADQGEDSSLLQRLLEEIYEEDQRARQILSVEAPTAMSVDWLMARALWECPCEYENEKVTPEMLVQNKVKKPMQDPLFCAIKIQASIMIEAIVEQLLERKMLRFVRDLIKDIEALCELGGDIAGLVFRLLDEGGVYQVPMPCYHFPAAILDGAEYETIGHNQRHRWLEYHTSEQNRAKWDDLLSATWDDERNILVSLLKDPRQNASVDSNRVAKVVQFHTVQLPFRSLGHGDDPECEWLEGGAMKSKDGKPYEKSKLRIVKGPHESWKNLGKQCGVSWQAETETEQVEQAALAAMLAKRRYAGCAAGCTAHQQIEEEEEEEEDEEEAKTPVRRTWGCVPARGSSSEEVCVKKGKDGNVQRWKWEPTDRMQQSWVSRCLGDKPTSRTLVEPAILAVEGAGQSGQDGLLHILVHHVDSGNIDCKIFGTEAVKLLVAHKWNEYGRRMVVKEILVHFIMVIAPWTGIMWAVAHVPSLDGEACEGVCESWLFYGLSEADAVVAIILSFAAAFLSKAATRTYFCFAKKCRYVAALPRKCACGPEPKPDSQHGAKTKQSEVKPIQRKAYYSVKPVQPYEPLKSDVSESKPEAETTNQHWGINNQQSLVQSHAGHWSARDTIILVIQLVLTAVAARLLSRDANCHGNLLDDYEEQECHGLKHAHISLLLGIAMSVLLTAIWRSLIDQCDEWRSHFRFALRVEQSDRANAKRANAARVEKSACDCCAPVPGLLLTAGIGACSAGMTWHSNRLTGVDQSTAELLGWFVMIFGIIMIALAAKRAMRRATWAYLDVWNIVDLLSLGLALWTAGRLLFHTERGLTTQTAAVGTALLWFRVINYLSAHTSTAPFVRT
jgi:hypothetical protein